MKELEKIINDIKAIVKKTKEDIRDGEKYLKDPILHQFYEGKVPALRKKKQELTRLLVELEKIAEKSVDLVEESKEDVEEDNAEEMSGV